METLSKLILHNADDSTKAAYDRVKRSYLDFRKDQTQSTDLVVRWLKKQEETKAPSTLWTEVSHLSNYLKLEEHIELERELINKFLKILEEKNPRKNAPDFEKDEIYSYFGALRVSEAISLKWTDVLLMPEYLTVRIIRKKNDKAKTGTSFIAPKHPDPLCDPLTIWQIYESAAKPVTPNERGWVKYCGRHKKLLKQTIGRGTLGGIATIVASFLGKPDPQTFTSHSFRLTSPTTLVDEGVSTINLKCHAGWKSDSVAEGYLNESKQQKFDNALKLTNVNNTNFGPLLLTQTP